MKSCNNCERLKYNEKELILARLDPQRLLTATCRSTTLKINYQTFINYKSCNSYKPKST